MDEVKSKASDKDKKEVLNVDLNGSNFIEDRENEDYQPRLIRSTTQTLKKKISIKRKKKPIYKIEADDMLLHSHRESKIKD